MEFKLLCTSDPRALSASLEEAALEAGASLLQAEGAGGILSRLAGERLDAVVVDFETPGGPEETLIRELNECFPSVDIVVFVPREREAEAERAVGPLISELLPRDAPREHIRARLSHLVERRRLRRENRELRSLVGASAPGFRVVAGSPAMRRVLKLAERAAASDAVVLILGESGTGKEQIARAIHAMSPRARCPFVPVDSSALSANLIESELFGHVKGAFTGAQSDKEGLLVAARGGTIFLDEIGELPLELQAKLLRAIQERQVRPVGSNKVLRFEARILAATHRDLENEVKQGRFREDLFYRLSVVTLRLPPLRERREDIPLLVAHFLEKHAPSRRKVTGVSLPALQALERYDWPGNVRELENAIEHAIALGTDDVLRLEDLPARIRGVSTSEPAPLSHLPPEEKTLEAFERRAIEAVLAETRGNKREAARILRIGVSTLYRKLKRYGLLQTSPPQAESSRESL